MKTLPKSRNLGHLRRPANELLGEVPANLPETSLLDPHAAPAETYRRGDWRNLEGQGRPEPSQLGETHARGHPVEQWRAETELPTRLRSRISGEAWSESSRRFGDPECDRRMGTPWWQTDAPQRLRLLCDAYRLDGRFRVMETLIARAKRTVKVAENLIAEGRRRAAFGRKILPFSVSTSQALERERARLEEAL